MRESLRVMHNNLSLTKKVKMKRELRAVIEGQWRVDDLAIVNDQIKTVSTHYI